MSDGFDNAEINAESVFDDLLAVAGDRSACNSQTRVLFIYIFKEFLYDGNRVAAVGKIL